MLRARGAGVVVGLLLVCVSASAQEVWLPASGDADAPWFAEVRRALSDRGVLARPGSACTEDDCALEALRELGATVALRVAVVDREARVRLLALDGRRAVGAVHVGQDGVAAAVVAALRRADAALEMGGRAVLLIEGTPAGALVIIDGAPAGHSPVRREVSAGAHSVIVRSEGFSEHSEDLVVAAGEVSEVHFELRAGSGATSAAPTATETARAGAAAGVLGEGAAPDPDATYPDAPETSGEVWNWVAGGALVVAGGLMIGSGMRTLAKDGDCVARVDASGSCTERVEFGTRSSILLGAGTLAVAGAILVVTLEPFTIDVGAAQ